MISEDAARLRDEWELADKLGDLPDDAVILVAGAYQGKLMEFLLNEYPNRYLVLGYDPQTWAVDIARERLKDYTGWVIQPFAIGAMFGTMQMGEWETDAASFVNTGPNSRLKGQGDMKEIFYALNRLNIFHVDLAIFNMEGYELVLMPYLIATTGLLKFDRVAVQWHMFQEEDWLKMDKNIDMMEQMGYVNLYDGRPSWTYHRKFDV